MELAEFLLARIAEDEEVARKWVHHAQQNDLIVRDPQYLGMFMPGWHQWRDIEAFAARALAECEAKRRIVDYFAYLCGEVPIYNPTDDPAVQKMGERDLAVARRIMGVTCGHLALPYADHPDYDETWRPSEPAVSPRHDRDRAR